MNLAVFVPSRPVVRLLLATLLLAGPAAAEMLRNGDFSQGFEHWAYEQANGATARISVLPEGPAGEPALHLEVLSIGDQTWRLQWSQKRLSITQGRPYVLTFWARARHPGPISVTCMQNHAPWDHSTLTKVELTTGWRRYEFPFTGAWNDDDARISFTNLGTQAGLEYWLARCSLQPR
jgi:hypothetical protein